MDPRTKMYAIQNFKTKFQKKEKKRRRPNANIKNGTTDLN